MDIAELRSREDFEAVLLRTLQVAWSREQGCAVTVRLASPGAQGQRWRFHPLHSAYTVADVGPAPRRFLANWIRYTSRRWRRPLQWLAGTLLSARPALAAGRRGSLVVTPPIPRARDMVLLPGNQRIRLFDFGTRRTRVYAKEGFSNTLMVSEIALRAGEGAGPYPPILRHDEEGATWFEEPLLDGWCLARCPSGVDPTAAVEHALGELETWSSTASRSVPVRAHAEGLVIRIRAGLDALVERFQHDVTPWDAWLTALVDHAGEGEVRVGPTHGDVQPGNIMVAPGARQATLIDWEHCKERMLPYDRLVLALGARYQRDLARHLLDFVAGRPLPWLAPSTPGVERSAQVAARFLLEDLTLQVEEAASGPYRQVTAGVLAREAVLQRLGPSLEALWRG
jgi:hypothetical protein